MDLLPVLAQLRRELENLEAAIASLERLQTAGPRLGRPAKTPRATTEGTAADKTGTDARPAAHPRDPSS